MLITNQFSNIRTLCISKVKLQYICIYICFTILQSNAIKLPYTWYMYCMAENIGRNYIWRSTALSKYWLIKCWRHNEMLK